MKTLLTEEQTGRGDSITNGAEDTIATSRPYRFGVRIVGEADLLFHRWNCEAVSAKATAAKGSKAKKTDNIESYIYRDGEDRICLPGEYLRQSLIAASKFRQDPRSPRKSAQDLVKAGLISLTPLASLGTKKWDYEHAARVQVQRNGITRIRPAMRAGWTAAFIFCVNLPEYLGEEMIRGLLVDAGRLCGVGDFRPTYGRFSVTGFEMLD